MTTEEGFVEKAVDYTKRKNVFRFRYLFLHLLLVALRERKCNA